MSTALESITPMLTNAPAVLSELLNGLSEEQLHTNEGTDTWSAFDVVGHLIHGENTDWIPRATIILSDAPDRSFEPFDRFAQFENSKGKNTADLLEEFAVLRASNLHALSAMNITEPMLAQEGIHPELGTVNLGQLLNTWAMHDLSHIAQIARVLAKQFGKGAGPWNQYIPLRKM